MSPILKQLEHFERYAPALTRGADSAVTEEIPQPGLSVSKPAATIPRRSIEELDVRLAQAGRRDAFDRLVRRHEDAVLAVTRSCLGHREDAADVTQETFLKAFVHIRSFRGGSSFRTWLLRIGLNTARSLRARERARKRNPAWTADDGTHEANSTRTAPPARLGVLVGDVADPSPASAPLAGLEAHELAAALARALSQLDDDARELLVRRAVGGEAYDSIAAACDVPIGTVKSKIHRARQELRARLAAHF